MGRFILFLGILLVFVGAGTMFLVFSVSNIEFVEDIMLDWYCEPNETTITTSRVLSFSGTQNSTDVFYCEDESGNRREITDNIALAAVIGFLAPFLTGMLMIFVGAWRMQRNLTNKAFKRLGIDPNKLQGGTTINLSQANMTDEQRAQIEDVFQSVSQAFGTPASTGSNTTLADRLQQLEDARQQGLISSAEYQRTRQAILDSMDDNI